MGECIGEWAEKALTTSILVGNIKLYQDTLMVPKVCDPSLNPETMNLKALRLRLVTLGPSPVVLKRNELCKFLRTAGQRVVRS